MILGITFEEKILEEITLEEYIELIKSQNVTLLELAPNFIDYKPKLYEQIYYQIKKHGFQFNFHLPSFADNQLEVSVFDDSKKEYIIKYLRKLNQIFDLENNQAILVFHGSKYASNNKQKSYHKTINFIHFMLKIFSKYNYKLTLAIETLNQNKYSVIGDSREDLLSIIKQVNNENLKICWDITHDYHNNTEAFLPNKEFLKYISHCHVHGFNHNETHTSLSDNTELFPAIKYAKKNSKPINIELLMQNNYLAVLKKDISTIISIN